MKLWYPPYEHVGHNKYKDHINKPINTEKILTIEKGQTRYYPDNEGIPSLRIWFGADDYHSWYFNNEKDREKAYNWFSP